MTISSDYFESIDDILGPREKRFFGAGFRKVSHQIRDIEIGDNEGEGYVKAKVSVLYPNDWSKKSKDIELRPHLSSIDALVLSVQLNEIYLSTKYGLGEHQRRKMWLRHFVMKAGATAQTDLNEFGVSMRHLETITASDTLCGNISIFECKIWNNLNSL